MVIRRQSFQAFNLNTALRNGAINNSRTDPGFFLGWGAPLRNGVTDW